MAIAMGALQQTLLLAAEYHEGLEALHNGIIVDG